MQKIKLAVVTLAMVIVGNSSIAAVSHCSVGIEMPVNLPITRAVEEFLQNVGIDYINFYVQTSGVDTSSLMVTKKMTELCDKLDLDFSISAHKLFPQIECIQTAQKSKHFKGIVFDELAHVSVINAQFCQTIKSNRMVQDPNKIKSMQDAYNEVLKDYVSLREKYEKLDTPVVATHVWPVLNHLAAKAGFIPCPKICKELYSPVSLSMGLGAAKQYNRPLWVDCDLWYYGLLPGHGPEEFRSNLLLAYWLGADRIYVEGCGFNLTQIGKQGMPFTMMKVVHDERYQLTEHGEILRWFCREYIPKNPRQWTFRDVVPDIVIIRKDDTCHGQRFQSYFPDNLFGISTLHSTSDTEAWLGLWNVLTYQKTGSNGLTYFKGNFAVPDFEETGLTLENMGTIAQWDSYLSRPYSASCHSFFVPLNGVVVYDHTASYELLKDAKLIFITGLEITESTMEAVKRCVEQGATCVGWHNLMEKHGFKLGDLPVRTIKHGAGKFVITNDFENGQVYAALVGYLNRPNEISYRFGNHRVVLRKVTDNKVEVDVLKGDEI
jgi:hypothetical protein